MITRVPSAKAQAILDELEARSNPANVAGMARYGIRGAKVYGVSMAIVRRLAKNAGRDHALAAELWKTGALEARLMAGFVEEPGRVTPAQMERWAKAFDSWALCDGICIHLFGRTPHAASHARAWAGRPEEFVKRAGFALMATLAVHETSASDAPFRQFLGIVEREADDPRNFVKKAVNWALRQIGKRNHALHEAAVATCRRLAARSGPARWVGADALRELLSPKTLARMRGRRSVDAGSQ
jgi:3-methyladenine DNA glycosylase AlkD